MTLAEFNNQASSYQLADVFRTGTFLATRWENQDVITLYFLPGGFLAEVQYPAHGRTLNLLRTYHSADQLAALYPNLPEWE